MIKKQQIKSNVAMIHILKVDKISKGSLDLIPSPTVNIQTGLYSNHGQESLLEL